MRKWQYEKTCYCNTIHKGGITMARRKAIKVGDVVYAVDPHGQVIEATIKSIDKEMPLPYELNIRSKARFYPREDLYLTREEATKANLLLAHDNFQKALGNTEFYDHSADAMYNEADGTFISSSGERISDMFCMTPEEDEEYRKLLAQMMDFCDKHSLPFFAVVCTSNDQEGKVGLMHSTLMPGPRTPEIIPALERLITLTRTKD